MVRWPMIGSILNHYRITKALGSGGMGEVYLADDTRLKRPVAIKILPAVEGADQARFEREAQALAALNHPNIVTIHSVEQSAERSFIVMEYIAAETLADVIHRGPLPLERLLRIAVPMVDAVSAAHERGVIHRDLKPANVMVDAHDRVKVLDFGLAKLRQSTQEAAAAVLPTQEATGAGRIVGTVAYMSPEQAEARPLDHRTDIFSLGVVLYEMAIGKRPFKGDTSLSVLSAVIRDTPKTLSEINPALPRELSRIVRHCLVKDPDRRYQSAKDLRNDLDELHQSLKSGELTAVPVSASPPAGRRGRLALMVVGIGAIVAIGAWLWLRGAAPGNAPPAIASYNKVTQGEGVERSPNLSPDGKWILYVKDGDIFLQSVTGQTPINLTTSTASVEAMPAFSPDGETIAFRSNRDGGGLFLMGRTGESVRRLTTQGFHPAWFPDGQRIVYATAGPQGPANRPAYSELWVASLSGEAPRLLFPGDAVQPRVSPNGKRIAFWCIPSDPATKSLTGSTSANRDIWTMDLTGSAPVRVTTHEANDWNPVWSPDGRWLYFLSNRAGSMNLWRVGVDEASGLVRGEPESLTVPASNVEGFSLSADGAIGAYAAFDVTSNIARVAFDSRSGTATGPPELVTTGANDFGWFDVTSDGRLIAATTSARLQEDIYIVSTDGGPMRQLTKDAARDRMPRWTRDNRQILSYSDRTEGYHVWTIDADGSGLRILTRGTQYPALSRDGLRLSTADQDPPRMFIHDMRDVTKPGELLPPFPPTPAAVWIYDWSPDGRQLAVNAGVAGLGGSWVYSFDTRTYRRVSDGQQPVWLSDGRRIIVGNDRRLSVVDTATGATKDVLTSPFDARAPRLARDDTQLYFLRPVTTADIWLLRFGTTAK